MILVNYLALDLYHLATPSLSITLFQINLRLSTLLLHWFLIKFRLCQRVISASIDFFVFSQLQGPA